MIWTKLVIAFLAGLGFSFLETLWPVEDYSPMEAYLCGYGDGMRYVAKARGIDLGAPLHGCEELREIAAKMGVQQ